MKKFLVFVAFIAVCISMNAHKVSSEKRDQVISNMIFNMIPVGNKFAITRTPISYYQYWVITGEKAHSSTTSVSQAAYVSRAKQEKVANTLNKECDGVLNFRIATPSEIMEAQKRGLQGDIQHHGGGTHGFYLVLPFKQWQPFQNAG